MTIAILPDVLHLFMDGFAVGGLLCGFPFIIGLAIGSVYRLISRA